MEAPQETPPKAQCRGTTEGATAEVRGATEGTAAEVRGTTEGAAAEVRGAIESEVRSDVGRRKGNCVSVLRSFVD